jgi:hypothetical protein
MGSGTGDGSNRPESQTDSPGAITGLSNLKMKMAAIDLKSEAFKVDQASLKEEVSTMTRSLENMVYDIIAFRQDMTNISARFCSAIADLKQLIINMYANKRVRKQRKPLEGSSTSSVEKRAEKSMETYEDIAHGMASSWTNMFESEVEGDTSDQNNVSQVYITPSQGKAGNNWCVYNASRVGIHRHLPVHKKTLNAWSHVQARRRESRRGYQSVR